MGFTVGRLAAGQSALVSRQQAAGSGDLGTVTYTKGATSIDLTGSVWIGAKTSTIDADTGQRMESGEVDFLCPVEDLEDFDPSPTIGRRITLAGGLAAGVYEIRDTDAGTPAVRHSDQTKTVWRFHTKRVGS